MVLGVFQKSQLSPSYPGNFGKENRLESICLLLMLSYVLCYEICYKYVMNMYVCRLGHMTHMTNKTPNGLWAYDLLS